MKYRILLILILVSTLLSAQDNQIENDSILEKTENLFIKKHHQQLNINFEVSNERTNYLVPLEEGNASVKSNLNIRYAFVFSYKFLSIRLGFRPSITDEEKKNKGDTKSFRLRVKLLFDRWSHQLEYNRHEGYYIANSKDFSPNLENDNFFIQFPNLTTNIFQGISLYKFNDNFSVRAVESQTEIQIKSAGTFMPGLVYKYYSIKGTEKLKISPNEIITRDNYHNVNGVDFTANAGYYYTFVYKKNWFAHGYVNPGVGIDFYNSTSFTIDESSKTNGTDVFFAFNTGAAIGYNGKKIFVGAAYDYTYASEKFHGNGIQIQPSRDKFHVYLGYRFRVPKQVRKPVEKIEDIVPILKEDDQN
jgi:hypothetical protein